MNVRGAGPGGMQPEAAQETETIQDLGAVRQPGDVFVVDLLIEIQAGLMPRQQVGFKLQSVQLRCNWTAQIACQNPGCIRQALELAGVRLIAFYNGARRENRFQRSQNRRFPLVHA